MRKTVSSTALGILACCSAFFAVLFPEFFLPFGLFSSILFAFCVYISSESRLSTTVSLTSIAVVSLAAAFFTGNMLNAMLAFIVFVPTGYAVSVSYQKKKGLNFAGGYVLIAGGLVFVLTYITYVYNETYPDFSLEIANQKLTETVSELISPFISMFFTSDISTDVIDFYVFSCIPSYFALWFLFSTVVTYFVFRICFRSSQTDMSFATDFTGFHVGRTGVLLLWIIVFIDSFISNTVLFAISLNFAIIEFAVIAYSGLSLIGYFIDFINIPDAVKTALYIFAIILSLLFSFVVLIFALAGLIDVWFNIRNHLKNSAV